VDELLKLIPEPIRDYFLIAPFILTILFGLVVGRILFGIKRINNDYIPLIVALLGSGSYTLVAWTLNQDYRAGLIGVNVIVGFCVGYGSTGAHQHIKNSKFLSSFPLLKFLVPEDKEGAAQPTPIKEP
jgi:hypothetical protein